VVFRFFHNPHVRLLFLLSLYVYVLGTLMSRLGLFRAADPDFLARLDRATGDEDDDPD